MLTTGLAFSGGKDSWACLWLNEYRLDKIQVIWIDAGKNYPELLESIEKAEKLCPHFVRVIVDRDGQNAFHGIPSDVVPVAYTRSGHETSGVKPVLIQSYLQCCYENIGANLFKYCNDNGITELIDGQRNDETHTSSSKDGDVVFGVKRSRPIEAWTSEEVLQFVGKHMELPDHFRFKHSSMDCYDCTAYRKETKDITEYRKINWPQLDKQYQLRNTPLNDALRFALED